MFQPPKKAFAGGVDVRAFEEHSKHFRVVYSILGSINIILNSIVASGTSPACPSKTDNLTVSEQRKRSNIFF